MNWFVGVRETIRYNIHKFICHVCDAVLVVVNHTLIYYMDEYNMSSALCLLLDSTP